MARIKMDGHMVFDSTASAASWLHSTGKTNAADARSVQGNINRAIREGGKAYGHTFERGDGPVTPMR